jgi:hypothetical protein
VHLDIVLNEEYAATVVPQHIVERVRLNLVSRKQKLALIGELNARQVVDLAAVLVGRHLHHFEVMMVGDRTLQGADVADLQVSQFRSQDIVCNRDWLNANDFGIRPSLPREERAIDAYVRAGIYNCRASVQQRRNHCQLHGLQLATDAVAVV